MAKDQEDPLKFSKILEIPQDPVKLRKKVRYQARTILLLAGWDWDKVVKMQDGTLFNMASKESKVRERKK